MKLCVASVVAESQPAKKNRHDNQNARKSTAGSPKHWVDEAIDF